MKRKGKLRLTASVSILLVTTAALVGWKTYSGSPRWPLSAGFHYVANFHPTSFPANSPFDLEGKYALSDLRDMKGTSFTPGFYQMAKDPNNHNDGFSTWAWMNKPTQAFLGLTFTVIQGSSIVEADIHFNSRQDYKWATQMLDPNVNRAAWPVDFRSVARHETMHAIGLDHDNTDLCNMNLVYDHGAGIPHTVDAGVMPHADDKGGIRSLYPKVETVINVMATSWREPPSTTTPPRKLSMSGTYKAGAQINVPCYLENQGTGAIPTGSTGVSAGVYLSLDSFITPLDTRIGQFTFTGAWPAHASFFYSFKATLPTSIATGTYYVGVIFDDTGILNEQFETDNTCYLGKINVLGNLGIWSVWPPRGTLIGDDPVTIDGDGFTPGLIRVDFGGAQATSVQVQSHSRLTCRTPMNLGGGLVDVKVSQGSQFKTLFKGFTYEGGDLVCTGNPKIGVPFAIGLSARVDPIHTYAAAASLSATSGLPLGIRTFPLDLDNLLIATANNWLPQIFSGFRGLLDSQGRSLVSIKAPRNPALVGVSIHVAFLTLDPTKPLGIRTVSRPKMLKVEK